MSTGVKHRPSAEQRTADRQKATSMYLDGKSIRDIATELGRSFGYVRARLLESGTVLRGRGGPRKGSA